MNKALMWLWSIIAVMNFVIWIDGGFADFDKFTLACTQGLLAMFNYQEWKREGSK